MVVKGFFSRLFHGFSKEVLGCRRCCFCFFSGFSIHFQRTFKHLGVCVCLLVGWLVGWFVGWLVCLFVFGFVF